MSIEQVKSNRLYYPPGGILIWLIVFVELITFMMALLTFVVNRSTGISAFQESQLLLNPEIGIVNTLFLVTAGYFMAQSLRKLKQGDNEGSVRKISVSILFGLLFLALKSYEYFTKISHGIGLDYSDFFMYYWFLTGFHFIHVLAGLIILFVLIFHIKKGTYSESNYEDVETGAVFWHMCDLIWLLLFPILYLL